MDKLIIRDVFDKKLFWQTLFYGNIVILADISQLFYWIAVVLGPFIFFSNKIKLIDNINAKRALKFYFISILIIIITAMISGNLEYPIKRVLVMISILVSLFFFQNRIKSSEDILAVYWAFIIVSIFLVFLLLKYTFQLKYLFNFELTTWFGKNSSAAILFIGFLSTFCLIYLHKSTILLLILQSVLLISILMTGSIKFIIISFFIIFYYLFNSVKSKQLIKSSILIIFVVLITLRFLPLDSIVQSYEYRIVSSRILTFVGLRDYAPIKVFNVTDGRESYIKDGLNIFIDNPFFGVGLENTRLFFGTYTHNTFVELLAGGGIILGVSFILFLFYIFKGVLQINQRKIKYFIMILFVSIVIFSQAQRIYDNRIVLMFLFSLLYINPIITIKNV